MTKVQKCFRILLKSILNSLTLETTKKTYMQLLKMFLVSYFVINDIV